MTRNRTTTMAAEELYGDNFSPWTEDTEQSTGSEDLFKEPHIGATSMPELEKQKKKPGFVKYS